MEVVLELHNEKKLVEFWNAKRKSDNCHKQTIGRNMDVKISASESSERREEHGMKSLYFQESSRSWIRQDGLAFRDSRGNQPYLHLDLRPASPILGERAFMGFLELNLVEKEFDNVGISVMFIKNFTLLWKLIEFQSVNYNKVNILHFNLVH